MLVIQRFNIQATLLSESMPNASADNLARKIFFLARNLRELAREAYLGIPQGSPKDPLGIRQGFLRAALRVLEG